MIECIDLTKYFGDFLAVDHINLMVDKGEVLALLGPNGAGKTTTVRMMTSILQPSSGTARLAGYDVVTEPEKVRAHVGVLTEQHGLYERMKGMEYLEFFGRVYHLSAEECRKRALDLMERFGLTDALDKRLGEYSKGMKQKLALVRAMLHNPPVLLLDEPTSAMDPLSAKQVRDAIIELQKGQRTFLITTHNLTEAQLLADRIAIIRHGRIIANGTFNELVQQFVGQPMMELRINGQLNGLGRELSDIVTVQSAGINWLRYQVEDAQVTNPLVLRRLLTLGVEVVTLSPVTQTLEDVYLQVVKEDETNGN
ncbi:MAG: ABC transporter ATP-binding protein [Phototrophicales bacterium]|nr:MAG: ABC transporter ATP-binding protein [Phototrophicales bacterium]RMG70120.1 MAG: ABC transporter ATP-binding protein [Chloroflexota bacterium]